jgi:hypothetical protein
MLDQKLVLPVSKCHHVHIQETDNFLSEDIIELLFCKNYKLKRVVERMIT